MIIDRSILSTKQILDKSTPQLRNNINFKCVVVINKQIIKFEAILDINEKHIFIDFRNIDIDILSLDIKISKYVTKFHCGNPMKKLKINYTPKKLLYNIHIKNKKTIYKKKFYNMIYD